MDGMSPPPLQQQENQDAWLTLSLAPPSLPPPPPPPAASPPPPPTEYVPLAPPMHPIFLVPRYPLSFPVYQEPEPQPLPLIDFSSKEEEEAEEAVPPARQERQRKRPVRPMKPGKRDTIDPPPFPWATPKRATVYSLDHLLAQGLTKIRGTVKCNGCEAQRDDMEFDLQEKFGQVARFIAENKHDMHDRAPSVWKNPVLPTCESCGQGNSMRPVITKKREINWLFLLLGQMIGCCKLEHLKYFCKHTKNHRTGAKDRLLYLTYLGICKQLQPQGPFNV